MAYEDDNFDLIVEYKKLLGLGVHVTTENEMRFKTIDHITVQKSTQLNNKQMAFVFGFGKIDGLTHNKKRICVNLFY